jgi:hypothetical protein
MFNDRFRFGKHLTSFHSDCISDPELSNTSIVCSDAAMCPPQPEQYEVACNVVDDQEPPQKTRRLDIKNLAAKYMTECKSRTNIAAGSSNGQIM